MIDANVYILDKECEILGGHFKIANQKPNSMEAKSEIEESRITRKISSRDTTNIKTYERQNNLFDAYQCDYENKTNFSLGIPISSENEKIGDLFISRYSSPFGDDDLMLAEFSATVVGIKMQGLIVQKNGEKERMVGTIYTAMNSLSYSERKGIQMVFEDLKGFEGIIVLSKIADRSKMARTVFVNALRKIESAGIIKSKSLGMKGTYIRVLNKKLFGQLDKMNI